MTTTKTTTIYDFDHTIYNGDASFDFIMYCMLRRPGLWKYLPRQAVALMHYILGTSSRKRVKQAAFVFLRGIKDIDATLESFWNKHEYKVAEWYIAQQQSTDIIISASPEFLLKPIAKRLGINTLIATAMDPATGAITGKNCRGAEKLERLKKYDPSLKIDSCYSDHLSDLPLFEQAANAYVVKKGQVTPLAEYKPSKLDSLSDPAFIRFLLVGCVNAFLGIVFSFLISLTNINPLLAYALGYAASLVISYFLNAAITFKEVSFSLGQFWRFCLSYIPNFLIVFAAVYILVDVLNLFPLLSYILAAVIAAPVTFLLLSKFTFTRGAS
jgi:HAD superfamily phosphoserine phosphatase-like hydrolase